MTPPIAAIAVLFAFAAAWELAGAVEGGLAPRVSRALAALAGRNAGSLGDLASRLRLPDRLARAGLAATIDPGWVIAGKLAGAAAGALIALIVTPVVPARGLILAWCLLTVAGFLLPDALLERAARRRRAGVVAALPDALDLLAVGAASGRAPASVFGEIAAGAGGPLAVELAETVAEIECGAPVRLAVDDLRRRVGGVELGALAASLERSRSYGSPLAEQLHLQATELRRETRRRIEERAARAAPKIQLVVALVLVPSVLLTILAAIVAHADGLLGQFEAG